MHAHAIAYGPDERRVALAWPQGLLEVHAVREADGAPEALLSSLHPHGEDVVHLAFTPTGELVSVARDGSWALVDARGARVLRAGTVGAPGAHGSLSPSGRFLYLASTQEGRLSTFRVELQTGEVTTGASPDAHPIARASVFALDDAGAACHFHGGGEEGLFFVDFQRGTVERRLFVGAPRRPSPGSEPVLDLSPALGLGVRRDHGPLEMLAAEGRAWLLLKLQLFALPTLEPLRSLATVGFRVDDGRPEVRAVCSAPEGSAEYVAARERLLESITAVRLSPARRSAWVALDGEKVREVGLDGEWRSPLVQHGGPPRPDAEVAPRSPLLRRAPLTVGPSGQLVAFGAPSTFFNRRHLDLEDGGVRLPPRPARAPVLQAPEFLGFTEGGRHLVLAHGDEVLVLDAEDGGLRRRFALEPGSGEVTGLSLSPEGTRLALSLSGGEPLLLGLDDGAITGLGGPANTLGARFLPDGRLLLVHHQGAVVVMDLESGQRVTHRAGDEGPEGAPLSTREEAHGFACWTHEGSVFSAVCDARDVVQTYALVGGRVRTGPSIALDASARLLACDGEVLAVAGRGTLLLLDARTGELLHALPVEEPLLLERGESSGALLVFDREEGVLSKVCVEEGALLPLLAHRGRAMQVALSEPAQRMLVLEASGTLHLKDLDTGRTVALLELSVEANGGRVLKRRSAGLVVPFPKRNAPAREAGARR
ncbi:MAG: hypothetical protein L0Y64_03430 [Myxococcaceae bacterium]|nr:hypothetical protein [Myxococcaceae bacterium]